MPDQLVKASVEGITNNISIKAKKVRPEVIKQKIEEALKREVEREVQGISVEVSGGRVTLSGTIFFADFRNLQMSWNIFS